MPVNGGDRHRDGRRVHVCVRVRRGLGGVAQSSESNVPSLNSSSTAYGRVAAPRCSARAAANGDSDSESERNRASSHHWKAVTASSWPGPANREPELPCWARGRVTISSAPAWQPGNASVQRMSSLIGKDIELVCRRSPVRTLPYRMLRLAAPLSNSRGY